MSIKHTTTVDIGDLRTLSKPIHLMQYDKSLPEIEVHITKDGQEYTIPSGYSATIRWGKPDKHGCTATGTVSGSTVTFKVTEQMACVAGRSKVTVEIVESDSSQAGTAKFEVIVDSNPIGDNTIVSDSEISDIQKAIEAGQNVDKALETATAKANEAKAQAERASSFSANASTSADTATSKATEASTSATKAKESETNAKAQAERASSFSANASTSADTATSKATEASTSATKAKESETNAKQSETNASNSAKEAKESADSVANIVTDVSKLKEEKVNYADALTLEEIAASTSLDKKVASASALSDIYKSIAVDLNAITYTTQAEIYDYIFSQVPNGRFSFVVFNSANAKVLTAGRYNYAMLGFVNVQNNTLINYALYSIINRCIYIARQNETKQVVLSTEFQGSAII